MPYVFYTPAVIQAIWPILRNLILVLLHYEKGTT